jgi:hypothetical protein
MLKKQAITPVFIYSIILMIVTVAAFFSVNVTQTIWLNWLDLVDLPDSIMLIGVMGIILFPIAFMWITAFAVTCFLLTLFHRPYLGKQIEKQKGLPKILAMIGAKGIVACIYASAMFFILPSIVIIWRYYEHTAIRPPDPYPGVMVEAEPLKDLAGVLGMPEDNITTITYVYSVQMPLNEMEEYYTVEMNEHCMGNWAFVETDYCTGYLICRQAECDISHPLVSLIRNAKHFDVTLRSISRTETMVVYTVVAHDPMGGWFPDMFDDLDNGK